MAKMEAFVQLFMLPDKRSQAPPASIAFYCILLDISATQDLFETLTEPTPAVEDRFERTIKMLDDNFTTAKNTPLERHCFLQMAPNSGETADQFVAHLRLQAQHCDFTDVEDQIRDQLEEKIGPVQLRRKLLETSNIKLHDALKVARGFEAADQQSRQITQSSSDVNAVGHACAQSKPRNPSTHGHVPSPAIWVKAS